MSSLNVLLHISRFLPIQSSAAAVSSRGNQSQLILIARCRLNPFSSNNHFLLDSRRFLCTPFSRNLHASFSVGSHDPVPVPVASATFRHCLHYVANRGLQRDVAKKRKDEEPDQLEKKEILPASWCDFWEHMPFSYKASRAAARKKICFKIVPVFQNWQKLYRNPYKGGPEWQT